jgi:MFS family permease
MTRSTSNDLVNSIDLDAPNIDSANNGDITPDGGYGWVIVGSCFTVNCFTWGVTAVSDSRIDETSTWAYNYMRQSFGVYLSEYLTSGLFPEAKPIDYGFVGGFNFTFAMLLAPLATYLTRRYGKRSVMLCGSLFQCSGYIAASFSTKIWHLYLAQGVLVGSGIGFLIIPSMAILSQWFSRYRSFANGISSAGSGIGGVAFSWGTASMIRSMGLAWALRTTGLITLAASITATFLIRDRNHHIKPTQLAFDVKLLRRYDVVLLLLWAFISMFGYITLLFSLSDFALSIHLSREQGTDIVGFLNLGTAVGRPIIGIFSDRFSRANTAGVLTLICGLSCFAFWLPATTFGLSVFFSLLCGAILGVFWMVSHSLLSALLLESQNPLHGAKIIFRLLAPCASK